MLFLTVAEIVAEKLPGMPTTHQGILKRASVEGWKRPAWKGVHWQARIGRGGGVEYAASVLPEAARLELLRRRGGETVAATTPSATNAPIVIVSDERTALWAAWRRQTPAAQAAGHEHAAILARVTALEEAGSPVSKAVVDVARTEEVSAGTLWRWRRMVAGYRQADWEAVLTPTSARSGRKAVACDERAWEMLRSDWLRLAQPSFESCLRRVAAKASEEGWVMPSARTLRRRLAALPRPVVIAAREGDDALRRAFPAQERTRAHMHALYGANADGHKFDVFVRWDDGKVSRPVMVAFQDLYSNLILGWRIDRAESAAMVRLALGDVFERHGIPERCWLDNGRGFASKWITGGTPNRYRFKVREEDPAGILTMFGVEVHWTTPYAGQSKPIERGWRDMADAISKHPAFAGAYCGPNPMAKPADYGTRAVPEAEFRRVVAEGIAEHNARPGRETEVCGGVKSFQEVFDTSYAAVPIQRATETQRRVWMLAAEGVRVRQPDGAVWLLGNRFWAPELQEHMGRDVTLRFDPHNVHAGVDAWTQDGRLIGRADVIEAVGFDDVDAAREQARARRAWMRHTKELLAAERTLSPAELAAMMVKAPLAPEPVTASVIKPVFGDPMKRTTPMGAEALPEESEADILFWDAMRAGRDGGLSGRSTDDQPSLKETA